MKVHRSLFTGLLAAGLLASAGAWAQSPWRGETYTAPSSGGWGGTSVNPETVVPLYPEATGSGVAPSYAPAYPMPGTGGQDVFPPMEPTGAYPSQDTGAAFPPTPTGTPFPPAQSTVAFPPPEHSQVQAPATQYPARQYPQVVQPQIAQPQAYGAYPGGYGQPYGGYSGYPYGGTPFGFGDPVLRDSLVGGYGSGWGNSWGDGPWSGWGGGPWSGWGGGPWSGWGGGPWSGGGMPWF